MMKFYFELKWERIHTSSKSNWDTVVGYTGKYRSLSQCIIMNYKSDYSHGEMWEAKRIACLLFLAS
jgi:hypothetical protein